MVLLRQVRLVGKSCLRGRQGRHHQEGGEALVVAFVSARVAIAVVGGQLGGVLAQALCPAVVLEEEAELPWSASVAAVAIRAEASARTSRGRTPFHECFVTAKASHQPGRGLPDHGRDAAIADIQRLKPPHVRPSGNGVWMPTGLAERCARPAVHSQSRAEALPRRWSCVSVGARAS